MEYLLKASAITLLFYVCYKLFLQKETFFQSNRWFLFTGLISSFVLPLVVIPVYVTKTIAPINFTVGTQNTIIETPNSYIAETISWSDILTVLYFAGLAFLASKFVIQLFSLVDVISKNKHIEKGPYKMVKVNNPITPFSFFNYIVYNPSHYSQNELDHILTHEKVHANQLHSIDILIMHIVSIVFWFNPVIWLYKKDLQQNLEFIADNRTQDILNNSKSYQYILLKNSVPNYQMALANNFFNSLIKKRIVMLQKNRSRQSNQLKMALVLPLLAIFLMSFNTAEIITYNLPNTAVENEVSFGDEDVIIVTKSMTDDQLDEIVSKMEKQGVSLKFKGVKRNSSGEITNIKISAKTDKSNANINEANDDGINPIQITIDGNSISIGDMAHSHKGKDYYFESNDGKHKIHTSKSGSSVFVYSDDEHDGDHEVIEDEDKIIIKSGAKVHEIKKVHKDKNIWHSDDDEIIEIKGEGDNDVIIIKKDKDGNVSKSMFKGKEGNIFISDDAETIDILGEGDDDIFIIKKDDDGNYSKSLFNGKGKNVWISDDDDEDTYKIKTIGKGDDKIQVFISGDSGDGKDPLYIVDGKEVKDFDLEPDQIETMNVLKGEAATKKYGDKGKNGVIEVKTKKDD